MSATHTPNAVEPEADLERALADAGCVAPRWWSNGPDEHYEAHVHGYDKVLLCAQGSITFHTHDGDFTLHPGDRLDVDRGTEHAATVGLDGVTCVEATREA